VPGALEVVVKLT
jgi:hypothetical protein